MNNIKSVINSLESSKISMIYFALTFFFAVTVRNLLETFSSNTSILMGEFLHYYLFYASLALVLVLLMHFATKEKVGKIVKVVLPSFLIVTLPPVLDFIISLGRGFHMAYMTPKVHQDILSRFFTFFGTFEGSGITLGMRIEIALVVAGSFFYFFIKNRNILKSLFFSFLTYSLIFVYVSAPFIFGSIETIKNFYLLSIFVFGVYLFYLHNKRHFVEIIKDIRPMRLSHFLLMFVLGITLGAIYPLTLFSIICDDIFGFVFLVISIVCAWMFSVITNNIEDYEIDKITNKNRLYVSNAITRSHYKRISWILLALSLLYSSMTGFSGLFLIVSFIGSYFLYSMPPLRLKRITFFSKLPISFGSLVLIMLGFDFIGGGLNTFPIVLIPFFTLFLTASINFIDIKDYKGDKEIGIRTLPVVLGLKKSKILIGISFLLSYVFLGFLTGTVYLSAIWLFFGLLQFTLINKKEYKEKYVLLTYLLSLLVLLAFLVV